MKKIHFEHEHKEKHLDESFSNIRGGGGFRGGRRGGGFRHGGFGYRGRGYGGYYGGIYNPYAVWSYPTTAYYIDSENQGDSRVIEITPKGKQALDNFRKNKKVNAYFYFLSAIENGGKFNEGALRSKLNLSNWVTMTDEMQLNGLIKIS